MNDNLGKLNIFSIFNIKNDIPLPRTFYHLKNTGDFVQGTFVSIEREQKNKWGNKEAYINLFKDKKIITVSFKEEYREELINKISKIKPGQIIKIILSAEKRSQDPNKSPFKLFTLDDDEGRINWNFLKIIAYKFILEKNRNLNSEKFA